MDSRIQGTQGATLLERADAPTAPDAPEAPDVSTVPATSIAPIASDAPGVPRDRPRSLADMGPVLKAVFHGSLYLSSGFVGIIVAWFVVVAA